MMAEGSGQNGLRSNQASLNHTNPWMLSPLGTVWLRQFYFSNSIYLFCLWDEHLVYISMLVLSIASQFAHQFLSAPFPFSHTSLHTKGQWGLVSHPWEVGFVTCQWGEWSPAEDCFPSIRRSTGSARHKYQRSSASEPPPTGAGVETARQKNGGWQPITIAQS